MDGSLLIDVLAHVTPEFGALLSYQNLKFFGQDLSARRLIATLALLRVSRLITCHRSYFSVLK
jgi:hypothetical protein